MAFKNIKVLDQKDIAKMIKAGKSFKGLTKSYPLVDGAGNFLVTKIELKRPNKGGLYAVIHTALGNTQKDYNPSDFAKRQIKKYRKLARLKFPKIKDKQIQLIVDIAIATGIRAGSSESTDAVGILKLESGHVKCRKGKSAILDFVGKRGVHQKIKIVGSVAVRVCQLIIGKQKTDRLFSVTYPQVNAALKKVNLKDFRTKLANDLAWAYVKSLNGFAPTTKKEYKLKVKELCEVVAEQLGHKKGDGDLNLGTSKKSYIDPRVFQKLSSKVENKFMLLTKKEKEIAKKGNMWQKKLLPVEL